MCVILVSQTERLTASMIDRAIDANPDGNGLAWIEGRTVHFAKGISAAAARDLARTLPMPYVFHARIATVGGVRRSLCHPFPIDRRLNANQLSGTSSRGVLFHNGHWCEWSDYVEPNGKGDWSDSRAMASLVSQYGREAVADIVPRSQRVVLLTKQGAELFGHGWTETSTGIWASNTNWKCRPFAEPRVPRARALSVAEQCDLFARRVTA